MADFRISNWYKPRRLSDSTSSDSEGEQEKTAERKLNAKTENCPSRLESDKTNSSPTRTVKDFNKSGSESDSDSSDSEDSSSNGSESDSSSNSEDSSSTDSEDDPRNVNTSSVATKRKLREDEKDVSDDPVKKKRSEFKNFVHTSEKASSDSGGKKKKSALLDSSVTDVKETVIKTPGLKMMENMGYKEGEGLGKYGQGRTSIIEASKQRGRRGLGLKLEVLEPSDVQWNFEKDEVSVKEKISWMPQHNDEPPLISQLKQWAKEDLKKETIEDETHFCDPEVLQNVLSSKSVFDKLEPSEMTRARTRANTFETISEGMFQNRAAMKMANMDACFDFMFTDPKDDSGLSLVDKNEPLYFADICAGPGGFSEYVLWRKKWECKGFGFTLKESNDFRLNQFYAGSPETFEPHYGVGGDNGDGDIRVPENLQEFQKFVLSSTEAKGVHVVMADGGFSVKSRENIQEILSKRLYLCQFLCAMLILRTNGHFVCKLFDVFTPFSAGLVYLMHRAFKQVCIHKPNTSRPANSERYIICKWRRQGSQDICNYLFEINCRLGQLSTTDISQVVPITILKSEKLFYEYIVSSNNSLGKKQVVHLAKIKAFMKNSELHDPRQDDFRKECLAEWKIPDVSRRAPTRLEPKSRFQHLMKDDTLDFAKVHIEKLSTANLKSLRNIYDFHCVVYGENDQRGFFLSLGRKDVFRYDPEREKWLRAQISLELPPDTLLYGEVIPVFQEKGKVQRKTMAFQIIDALFIGGTDVRNYLYEKRTQLSQKLVKAVSKSSRPDLAPVTTKKVWQLKDVDQLLNRLSMKDIRKGRGRFPTMCYEMEDGRFFIPSGLLFMKTIRDPWITAFSKTHQTVYYYNVNGPKSEFHRVPDSVANVETCFKKRVFWSWDNGVYLVAEQEADSNSSIVHGNVFQDFIHQRLRSFGGV